MPRNRDYKKEYKDYHSKPEQIKRRTQRNAARRKAAKKGLVKKGDGKHVHHSNAPRRGSLAGSRTKVIPAKKNLKMQPKRGKKRNGKRKSKKRKRTK